MATVLTDSSNYENIAYSIRAINGESTQYYPNEMAAAISELSPKESVLYTEQILTEDQKAQARVNIGVDVVIDAHISNKNNPHVVQLHQLGVTATAAELNCMSGVTGNIQEQINEKFDKIQEINNKLADLMYEPIAISSFTHNAGTKERGATVTSVTLSWATNKTPSILTIDGESLDVNTTSKAISGLSITWDNNKTWTLNVTDERDAMATKSVSITFCNNIYYGVGTTASGFDSAFVTSLSKKLQSAKAYDFTVNPTAQYIYYAVPTRLGTVTFKVGGFEGGFEAPETVSVTNGSGYTENYYVYRSTNKITGSTAVDVT